jgi:predicted nucleic acid-binding protein
MTHRGSRRNRLFLDANVLISAAWKDASKVTRIWHIPNVELVSSEYVLAECRRNLPTRAQQDRLSQLLASVRVIDFSNAPTLDAQPLLPEKDRPVLAAAILSRSDFLVTGDRKHFGAWYGTSSFGLRIEPPARFPEVLLEDF